MGFRIVDLQGASLPLQGTEILEIEQGGNSRRVAISDLLPGFDNQLAQDIAIATDQMKGGYMVGYRGRTVGANLDDAINVLSYGPVDTQENTDATVAAALTAADLQGKPLIFPAGRYELGQIPNFAKSNRHIIAQGRVVLKSNGTGWALDLSAGASNMYNFHMVGDFVIEGNANNTGGVHIQGLHHSVIELRAMNVPGQAFKINYGVLTKYRLTASINVGPASEWAIVPTAGLVVDGRNTGEFTSACWFDIRLEGINGVGLDVISCQQSSFTGTSEHQTGIGIRTGTGSRYNTFMNVDVEQNLANDLWIGGYSDLWLNMTCRSTAVTNNIEVVSGAEGNKFVGGDLRCANMNNGSFGTSFDSCRLSDNASLGFKGTGGYTHINCVRYNTSGVVTARYTARLGQAGTFTPRLEGGTTAGTQTYSVQSGFFNVISNYLHFEISITLTAKDAAMAGTVLIAGLPYAADSTSGRFSGGPVGLHGNFVTPSTGYTGLAWRIGPGQSALTLFASAFDKALATLQSSAVGATATITIAGSYPLLNQQ